MTAKKCDRCGKYCDILSARSSLKFYRQKKPDVSDIDLCPDCTEDIETWLRNEAVIIRVADKEEEPNDQLRTHSSDATQRAR